MMGNAGVAGATRPGAEPMHPSAERAPGGQGMPGGPGMPRQPATATAADCLISGANPAYLRASTA